MKVLNSDTNLFKMCRDTIPLSKEKMETDVLLYARIPEGFTPLMRRGGKAMPRGKNVEWDFNLMALEIKCTVGAIEMHIVQWRMFFQI